MKKRRCVETSEDLVRAFADLFDDVVPETAEEIDAELRAVGYDPDKVGAGMQAAAERALEESPLNWRRRAQKELEDERARIADSTTTAVGSRADTIAAIEKLVARFAGQMAYAYRNLESETDEDLASLLTQLEYLSSQQRGQSEQ